jgi:hypothetical protein
VTPLWFVVFLAAPLSTRLISTAFAALRGVRGADPGA